jgi:hypothetical protein
MSSSEYHYPTLPASDNRPMWDIWLSAFQLPALTAADEIGVFTCLEQQSSSAEQIAQSLNLGVRATEALLNLLAALGFIVKRNGKFHLNELSRCYLLPESPHYWGGVLHTVRDMPVSHSMIMEAIRHDTPGKDDYNATGRITDEWKRPDFDDEKARKFTAKMHSHGFAAAIALARNHEFDEIRHLLDIGGGSGSYSIALAASRPRLICTVAELPSVCTHTKRYIEMYGVSERVDVIPLDMFRDPWIRGHDAILFSDIFHDWRREQCVLLAEHAHNSLPIGGRIFIHEVLLEDNKVGPLTANAYSLAMLMVAEGCQYTAEEIEMMISEAGFTDARTIPSYGYYSLITAIKH